MRAVLVKGGWKRERRREKGEARLWLRDIPE
jgi:hypothetical protein